MPDGIGYPKGPGVGSPAQALPGALEKPTGPSPGGPGGGGQFAPFKNHLRMQFNTMPPQEQAMVAGLVRQAPRSFAKLLGPEFTDLLQNVTSVGQGAAPSPQPSPQSLAGRLPVAGGPPRG